jgi:hypothetical protein
MNSRKKYKRKSGRRKSRRRKSRRRKSRRRVHSSGRSRRKMRARRGGTRRRRRRGGNKFKRVAKKIKNRFMSQFNSNKWNCIIEKKSNAECDGGQYKTKCLANCTRRVPMGTIMDPLLAPPVPQGRVDTGRHSKGDIQRGVPVAVSPAVPVPPPLPPRVPPLPPRGQRRPLAGAAEGG